MAISWLEGRADGQRGALVVRCRGAERAGREAGALRSAGVEAGRRQWHVRRGSGPPKWRPPRAVTPQTKGETSSGAIREERIVIELAIWSPRFVSWSNPSTVAHTRSGG